MCSKSGSVCTFFYTATKIPFKYSFSGNCEALVPISTFMCLWVIYIFPWSVYIFGCSKIDRPILEIHKSLIDIRHTELGDRTLYFCFGNKEAAQLLFLEKWEPEILIGFSQALNLQCKTPIFISRLLLQWLFSCLNYAYFHSWNSPI